MRCQLASGADQVRGRGGLADRVIVPSRPAGRKTRVAVETQGAIAGNDVDETLLPAVARSAWTRCRASQTAQAWPRRGQTRRGRARAGWYCRRDDNATRAGGVIVVRSWRAAMLIDADAGARCLSIGLSRAGIFQQRPVNGARNRWQRCLPVWLGITTHGCGRGRGREGRGNYRWWKRSDDQSRELDRCTALPSWWMGGKVG